MESVSLWHHLLARRDSHHTHTHWDARKQRPAENKHRQVFVFLHPEQGWVSVQSCCWLTNRLCGIVGQLGDTVWAKPPVTLPLFLLSRAACQQQPLNQFLVCYWRCSPIGRPLQWPDPFLPLIDVVVQSERPCRQEMGKFCVQSGARWRFGDR